MSAAPADRIKLSTGATTIIKGPISRSKSRTGDGAFSGTVLPGLSRDPLPVDEVTDSAHVYDGIRPPRPPPGPLGPWHDPSPAVGLHAAVLATHRTGHLLVPTAAGSANPGAGPSGRRLSLAPAIKPSASSSSGAAPGSGIQAPGVGGSSGVSFRRQGVASAPVAFFFGGGGGSGARDGGGRLLPAIGSSSLSSRASGNRPGSPSSVSPSRQPSRSFASLPSISSAAAASGDCADTPIVVSFVPRGPSKKGLLGGASRVGRSLTPALLASAAAAEADDDDEGAAPAGGGGGGMLNGIRRLLGKPPVNGGGSGGGGGGAMVPPISRNPQDDTARQDDKAAATATASPASPPLSSYPPAAASAVLLASYQREQERVNRVRSSLFGMADGAARSAEDARSGGQGTQAGSVGGTGAAAAAAEGSGGEGGAGGCDGAVAGARLLEEEPGESSERGLRSGKSFTQRALEDPNNPMFKPAQQLVRVQEKLSYLEDKNWRARAAESAPMERPILMAEGWKI